MPVDLTDKTSAADHQTPTNTRSHQVSAFRDDALGNHDAVGIARLIALGEIHPTEVVEAAIARAQQINPHLNAIASSCFDIARNKLQQTHEGVFFGVPTVVKDNEDLKGAPTAYGSMATPGRIARRSSCFVKHMDSLGLIPVGKSTLCEFGLTATTESARCGITKNPWHREYSAGGSSGGSAALVAAGVVPIAHGNDGGGSIRIPAACCGLVGLKPSRGRFIDDTHAGKLPINIVSQGMLSRSVRDTATFLHASEQRYRNKSLPAVGSITHPGKKPLKIGMFVDRPDGSEAAPDCVAAVQKAASLCEALGHQIIPIKSPFQQQMADDFIDLWSYGAFLIYWFGKRAVDRQFNRHNLENWTRGLVKSCTKRLHRLPFAIKRLRAQQTTYQQLFDRFDVLLSPTTGTVAPRTGALSPLAEFEEIYHRIRDFACFTPPQNITGAPAISLPIATSSRGLPVGVQFAAAVGDEKTLLELAFALEEANPLQQL